MDDSGDLLVTELKRGELAEDAIAQVLAYAAEYSRKKSLDELASLFATQSEKESQTGLLTKASSREDAEALLRKHVGEDVVVNESQVLLLVGEDFTPKALAICEYLNDASGEASFSIECWRYAVVEAAPKSYYFLLGRSFRLRVSVRK